MSEERKTGFFSGVILFDVYPTFKAGLQELFHMVQSPAQRLFIFGGSVDFRGLITDLSKKAGARFRFHDSFRHRKQGGRIHATFLPFICFPECLYIPVIGSMVSCHRVRGQSVRFNQYKQQMAQTPTGMFSK